ncbi:rhomboid family intramembrane serine protease [Paenibacillus sp. CAA11]|uniref:rhomboid family intramembrane serine protease n=1 Tax=Paenibacillus sp. CAA11 TaxID=1532905 RepID=UPI000D34256D|nr:rhomboid family intramembrane serine protease [Paenibacillus sp. CAA11]AWB44158.1 rhomboid family intramembrane serine protease [Paenibacillus sp. CAA11]
MIFIRYENWRKYVKYYPVTTLLVLANVLMFVILSLNGGSRDFDTLYHYGAVSNLQPEGEYWRFFAAMFLHHGFDHLLFNCFAIFVFAPPLERLMGWWRFAILYLASGFIANLLDHAYQQHMLDPYTNWIGVGASGAIYSVYGAFLYIALLQRQLMDEGSRRTLYALLFVGVIFSFIQENVGWFAHLGGLFCGFFIYGLIIRWFKPPLLRT